MAFDEYLAERIKRNLDEKRVSFTEKRMFGGWCAMVNDKMCVGVVKNELMARIGQEAFAEGLRKKGARTMDFTGRSMKGYVFVSAEGVDAEKDLSYWIDQCLSHNPQAKNSRKK